MCEAAGTHFRFRRLEFYYLGPSICFAKGVHINLHGLHRAVGELQCRAGQLRSTRVCTSFFSLIEAQEE